MERRPLKTRERSWAKSLARLLVRWRVRPNSISILSILFAALAGVAFLLSRDTPPMMRLALLITAAAGIQLRLLEQLPAKARMRDFDQRKRALPD